MIQYKENVIFGAGVYGVIDKISINQVLIIVIFLKGFSQSRGGLVLNAISFRL